VRFAGRSLADVARDVRALLAPRAGVLP